MHAYVYSCIKFMHSLEDLFPSETISENDVLTIRGNEYGMLVY